MNTTNVNTVKRVKTTPVVSNESTSKYTNTNSDETFSTIEGLIKDITNDCEDGDCVNIEIDKKGKPGVAIDFDFQSLPACCGILELGNLSARNAEPLDLAKILDGIVSGTKRTLVINTNGIGSCITFERALEKAKLFTLVKTFTNPGSKNTIKMWVSRN